MQCPKLPNVTEECRIVVWFVLGHCQLMSLVCEVVFRGAYSITFRI